MTYRDFKSKFFFRTLIIPMQGGLIMFDILMCSLKAKWRRMTISPEEKNEENRIGLFIDALRYADVFHDLESKVVNLVMGPEKDLSPKQKELKPSVKELIRIHGGLGPFGPKKEETHVG
jgi:hypothetical protein